MGDLVEDYVRANGGEMVVDALTFGDVPFQEADQGAATAQVRGQFRAGDAHGVFGDGIGVVSDHNSATCPDDPVQIRESLPSRRAGCRPVLPSLPIVPRQL